MDADGSQRLDYFDFGTQRSFCCGTAPKAVSETDVLLWILGKATLGDVIVQTGRVWMLYPPHDEVFIGSSQADPGEEERE